MTTIPTTWVGYRGLNRRYQRSDRVGHRGMSRPGSVWSARSGMPILALAIPGADRQYHCGQVWLSAWRNDLTQFRCPGVERCSSPTDSSVNELRHACVHCGLQKWSNLREA